MTDRPHPQLLKYVTPRTRMAPAALFLAFAALLPAAGVADETPTAAKPIAVNLIPGTAENIRAKIREAYGGLYSIVDVAENDPELVAPKLLTLSQHVSTIDKQTPAGEATVVYLIAADGTVLLPLLIDASDAAVGAALVESAARSRYTPARYRGDPVVAIGGQQLRVRPQVPAAAPTP